MTDRLTSHTNTIIGRVSGLAAAIVAALALCAAPAPAAQTHPFQFSFGSFSNPNGVAVDSSGEVYVADIATNTVQKFDATGKALNFSALGSNTLSGSATPAGSFSFANPAAIAVDGSASASAGDLYVLDAGDGAIDKFNAEGKYLGQLTGTPAGGFSSLDGLGVDGAGNLLAYEGGARIDRFDGSASNAFVQSFGYGYGSSPGFAVDPSGAYYTMRGCGCVEKWSSSGTDLGQVDDNFGGVALAVDPATGHLYVDDGSFVAEWDPSTAPGTLVSQFGESQLGSSVGSGGIAVNGPSGEVYVADPLHGRIDVYGPAVTVPDVSTEAATNLAATSATLNGSVNPDGVQVSECRFEYGTSASYGQSAPCVESVGAGTSAVSVHADVSGLSPQTTYHFRLVVANANGANTGADQTFTTFGAPIVDGESVSAITKSGATLEAQVNPDGLATTYHFEYGPTTAYGTSVPVPDGAVGSGVGDQAVSEAISGLQLGQTYHFRVVASNSQGTTDGPDREFSTLHNFGIARFTAAMINRDGSPDTQAGSHPYEFATQLALYTHKNNSVLLNTTSDGGILKDAVVELPPGIVGNPQAIPRCTYHQLVTYRCNPSAQIGIVKIVLTIDHSGGNFEEPVPVYNMVPSPGLPAQFAFYFEDTSVISIDSQLRTGGDYGIDSSINDVSGVLPPLGSKITLWGVPSDPSHNPERQCLGAERRFGCGSTAPPVPFFTMPTRCGQPLTTTMRVDSWQNPGQWVKASVTSPSLSGCGKLSFHPTVTVQPDTSVADSPSGLSVDLKVPQAEERPDGLATPDLKNTTVTLPAGVSVNPSSANGLGACTPAQIGIDNASEPSCPDDSKIGSVEVDTPLLPNPLKGAVYLAQQGANPFGSLLAIYVTAQGEGVLIKLAGKVTPDPQTGQLTTTFENNPQQPFSEFKLDFFGGPHGALVTPDSCGTFTSAADLQPWSAPDSGPDAVPLIEGFAIGSGCVSGFHPTLAAGSQNTQAGAGGPFVLSFSRSDSDEQLSGLQVTLPQGLVAKLAGVPLCGDAQATAGACPESSQVGTAVSGAGAGAEPFFLPGKVYLTGPYRGAPYGLAVVVPAIAGPFDLGTVVVRQSINIDRKDAHVTVTSDPLPSILDGIPLKLRRVDVTVGRAGFMMNPTSCAPMAIAATLTSDRGTQAALSSRFQVGGCGELPFKPGFKVSTSAKTSRVNGASLHAVVTAGPGQANIAYVRVALPKILPSRLPTLQKACFDAVFNEDPAKCPAASLIGTAGARTPVLGFPLSGPVYFVSHGGAAFPDLVAVLQGGGITIDLVGSTQIKNNVTTSTFASVPDVPVSRFDLTLPQGRYSALTALGNLCTQRSKLVMPTLIKGQNGAVIKRSTKIGVQGCARASGRRHTGHSAHRRSRHK